jgi:hypothetical protein
MAYISQKIGERDEFSRLIPEIKQGVRKKFFDADKGLFRNREDEENVSELVNSLAILSDVCTNREAERIAQLLTSDNSPLAPITLSMLCFKYDALLKVSEEYKDFILEDIEKIYVPMLDGGTGTVWETEVGEADFGRAGSLCHGWSAMPVYYYHKFLKA